jgi:hypothetical protein
LFIKKLIIVIVWHVSAKLHINLCDYDYPMGSKNVIE